MTEERYKASLKEIGIQTISDIITNERRSGLTNDEIAAKIYEYAEWKFDSDKKALEGHREGR